MTPILYINALMRQGGVVYHPVWQPMQVGSEGEPPPSEAPGLTICHTPLPAAFCTCGVYMLLEDTS